MRRVTRWSLVLSMACSWGAAAGLAQAQPVTTRVSTDSTGTQVAGASRQPSVSADGRFVAFSSTATTLVANDTNGSADVFVKDRQTGAVTRVSVRSDGTQQAGDSVTPDISSDGRYVTFASTAALVADDPGRGRYTTGIKALCPALGSETLQFPVRVAGTIESDGPPIVVERSTYWSAGNQFWAAGASTLLTPLP